MGSKRNRIGPVILAVLMVITFWVLLRDMPLARLQSVLWQLRAGWLVGGLGLMLL